MWYNQSPKPQLLSVVWIAYEKLITILYNHHSHICFAIDRCINNSILNCTQDIKSIAQVQLGLEATSSSINNYLSWPVLYPHTSRWIPSLLSAIREDCLDSTIRVLPPLVSQSQQTSDNNASTYQILVLHLELRCVNLSLPIRMFNCNITICSNSLDYTTCENTFLWTISKEIFDCLVWENNFLGSIRIMLLNLTTNNDKDGSY